MPRNIVFLVLDTVRKDYFDRFAKNIKSKSDTTFSQCRAASTWSVPSHASLFTGELPHQHGIHSESFNATFDFSREMAGNTFLDELQGYELFGSSSNIYVNEEFGFDNLFDEFSDHSIGTHWNAFPFPDGKTNFETHDSAIKEYIENAISSLNHEHPLKSFGNGTWLLLGDYVEQFPLPRLTDNGAKANSRSVLDFASKADEPFFAFVNFMDAHNPLQNCRYYDQELHSVPNSWSSNEYGKWELLIDGKADEAYTTNYRELYGAAIDYLDREIGRLLSNLESVTDSETTIVITADHGHNLGYDFEDNYFHHTGSMSEGVLHVPLEIINPPSEWPSEVNECFSHVKIPELIKSIANEEWRDGILGDPIVSERIGLLGESSTIDHEGVSEGDAEYWNRMIRCGYENDKKYEWDSLGQSQYFTLDSSSPSRQTPTESEQEVPHRIKNQFEIEIREYKKRWKDREQTLEFREEVAENLKDLGYL